jgi:predicted DNA binding protein
MPLFEMEFKVRHNCRLADFSFRHKTLRVLAWQIQNREIIEILRKKDVESSEPLDVVYELDEVLEHVVDEQKACLAFKTRPCAVRTIIDKVSEELDILHVSPVTYNGGWEYHKIVAFKHSDITRLIESFHECGYVPWILRKVPFNGFTSGLMTISTETLFSSLTGKQTDAILTAYAHGYYRLPRNADVKTIADKIGVSRTTFQEHLRKAENKIVQALVPHIHTWHHFAGSGGRHPLIRESLPVEGVIEE